MIPDPRAARAAQIDHPLRGELARLGSDARNFGARHEQLVGAAYLAEAHGSAADAAARFQLAVEHDAPHTDAARCALVRLTLLALPDAMRSHAVEALARDGIYAACGSSAPAGEETDAARTAARAMSEDECAAAQSDCAAAHRLASGLAQMINEQAAEEDPGDDEYYDGGYGYGEEEPDAPGSSY